MLSKDEELRVASFIDCLRDDIANEREDADLSPSALLWLAEKCKELNEEASGYYQSYMKANDELAKLREHYEG